MEKKAKFPAIEERKVYNVIVDSKMVCYSNKPGKYPEMNPLYSIVNTHLPGNRNMKYILVDRHGLVGKLGEHGLVFKELTTGQVERLQGYKEWHNPDMRIYELDFSMDVCRVMKMINWREVLNLWVTENCDKDERLVNAFKSIVIPLRGDPKLMQPLNNHQVWLTNTGTGKTMFNIIMGNIPNADLTESGLFGGNIDDYSKQQQGILHGDGLVMLDEIGVYDTPVVLSLLSYMEQGIVERYLKVPVVCRGNKTIILASNPPTKDMMASFVKFMEIVCSTEHPKRVGRRIGTYLVGNDYGEVNDINAFSGLRDSVNRLVHYAMIKYYNKRAWPVMKGSMKWIKARDSDKVNELDGIAKNVPIEFLSDFIKGNTMALQKLKMSALRYYLLERLDLLTVKQGYKRLLSGFVSKRDEIYSMLYNHNIDTLKKISLSSEKLEPTKECVKLIRAKFPALSYRTIGRIVGVSYGTVKNWLEIHA